jgi:hypothetical protein
LAFLNQIGKPIEVDAMARSKDLKAAQRRGIDEIKVPSPLHCGAATLSVVNIPTETSVPRFDLRARMAGSISPAIFVKEPVDVFWNIQIVTCDRDVASLINYVHHRYSAKTIQFVNIFSRPVFSCPNILSLVPALALDVLCRAFPIVIQRKFH